MRVDRYPARSHRAVGARLQHLALTLVLGLFSACGGGGGAVVVEPPELVPGPDGLSGQVLLPDFDLGRVLEQEPNDTPAQPFRLAPIWPRCAFEVAGTLGTSAAHYGSADAQDVLRIVAIAEQVVSLRLDFTADDPVGGAANLVAVAVLDGLTGQGLASQPAGPTPRELTFDALPGQPYDVVLTVGSGHADYVAAFALADPAAPQLKLRAGGAPPPPTAAAAKPAPAKPPTRPVVAPGPGEPACAGTHILVHLRDGCDADAFCERHGLVRGARLGTGTYRMAFETPPDASARQAALALSSGLGVDADVEWAEPDWILRPLSLPNDPELARQWNLRAVGAPAAWRHTKGNPGIVVAVIDSGILPHPDLAGATVQGYDFISFPDMAGDGDGRDLDPTDMGDEFARSGLSTWHGTHVAAIVAARQDDGYGGSGVAPLTSVRPIRVLGRTGGLVSDAVDAILFCAALHATAEGFFLEQPDPIVNLSLGIDVDAPDLRVACSQAANQGVLLVAAAGNTGGDVLYPAAYPGVMAVGAVGGNLLTTNYSSHGPEIEIAAPGGRVNDDQWNDGWEDGVLSAVRDETVYPAVFTHQTITGTSQAAPHVAGAAALMLALDPTLTASELRTILRGTALDLGTRGSDEAYGSGLLQAHEALLYVLSRLGTPSTAPPELMLPTNTVQFEGLRVDIEVPLMNAGAGSLSVTSALASTDDGAPWLSATFVPDPEPGSPVDNKAVRVAVLRAAVPSDPGRYAGTLRLGDASGVFGSIRVVLYVRQRTRLGEVIPVIAHEMQTGIARRKAVALPEHDYRYWFRLIPEGEYELQAGEDLDGDGFICEIADACGWHGGPTQADAVPVPFVAGEDALQGLSILLTGP